MIQLTLKLRRSRWNAPIRTAIAVSFAVVAFTSPAAQAQQYRILHNFTGGADGQVPVGGLAIDSTGSIYGVTHGQEGTHGTVYQLKPHNGNWVLNTLYTFTGGNDGSTPVTVVLGPDGALYGSTAAGGQGDVGVIFRLQPPPTSCRTTSCPWNETVLYAFMPGGIDAANPAGQLTFDASGAIYGTTEAGGGDLSCFGIGCGAIFKLTPSGGQWTESVLYGFQQSGTAGWMPLSGVVLDSSGNLYGTAFDGPGSDCGGFGCGTVYELTSSGNNQTLYRFELDGGIGGTNPQAGVTFDDFGNLLGATIRLGSQRGGTVFELSSSGRGRNFSVLESLYSNGGYGPVWDLTMDQSGNFYGTTESDGPNQDGFLFKLTPTDGGYQYTDLYSFQGGNDGSGPEGGVVVDAAGNVYGTTAFGGSDSRGTIWEFTP